MESDPSATEEAQEEVNVAAASKETTRTILVSAGIGALVIFATALFGDSAKKFLTTSPDAFGFVVLAVQAAIAALGGGALAKLATASPPKGWSQRRQWIVIVILVVAIPSLSMLLVWKQPAIGWHCYYLRAISPGDPSSSFPCALVMNAGGGPPEGKRATVAVGTPGTDPTIGRSNAPEGKRVLIRRIALLRQAIALDPDLLGAHYHLGLLLVDVGDYKAGLAELQVAGQLAIADFGSGEVEADGVGLDRVFAYLAWELARQGEPLVAIEMVERGNQVLDLKGKGLQPEQKAQLEEIAQARYPLYIAVAWASLRLEYFNLAEGYLHDAEEELKKADVTDGDGAGLRCLRAQLIWRRQKDHVDEDIALVAKDATDCLGDKQVAWGEPMSVDWLAFAGAHKGTPPPPTAPPSIAPTPTATPTTIGSATPGPSARTSPTTTPSAAASPTRRPGTTTPTTPVPAIPRATFPLPKQPLAR